MSRINKNIEPKSPSKNGWFFFSLGLAVSFALSLFIKSVLNSSQINHWIEESLKQSVSDNISIEYSSVSIEFTKGWMPWIGAVVEHLSVSSKDTCSDFLEFRTEKLEIPISFIGLLKFKFQIGDLDFGQSQIQLGLGCDLESPIISSSNDIIIKSNILDKPKDDYKSKIENKIKNLDLQTLENNYKNLRKNLKFWEQNITPYVRVLNIEHLEFVRGDWESTPISIKNLRLSWREKESREGLSISGWLLLGGDQISLAGSHSLLVQTFLSEQFSDLHINGNFKEGKILFFLEQNWEKLHSKFKLKLEQIPMAPIFKFAELFNPSGLVIDPKYMWLDCAANFDGATKELLNLNISLEICKIDGDLGRIEVSSSGNNSVSKLFKNTNQIVLSNVPVGKYFEFYQVVGLNGVITNFGKLFGSLIFNENGRFESFKGYVEGVELIFSRRGIREKQKINRVDLTIEKESQNWIVGFDQFNVDEGEVLGNLKVKMDEKFKNGDFEINLEKFNLKGPIQKLYFGSNGTNLAVEGKGHLLNGLVSKWEGKILLTDLKSQEWNLGIMKIDSIFMDSVLKLKFLGEDLTLLTGSTLDDLLNRWLTPLNLSTKDLVSDFQFKSQIEISPKLSKWKGVELSFQKKIKLVGEGSIVDNKDIEGHFIIKNKSQSLKWNYLGPSDKVKFWINENQSKSTINSKETYNLEVNMLELSRKLSSVSNQFNNPVSDLSKKVIDSAKKIIPESNP